MTFPLLSRAPAITAALIGLSTASMAAQTSVSAVPAPMPMTAALLGVEASAVERTAQPRHVPPFDGV